VFLALDNATDPYTVTKALLDTELYTILNDPENIYHDKASGLCYSPISYVEHNRSAAGSQAQKDDLIRLLEDKRCIPRYYSYAGEQPADAIGMPEAQKRRFDIDLEHQLILRRAREAEDQAVQVGFLGANFIVPPPWEHCRMVSEACLHTGYIYITLTFYNSFNRQGIHCQYNSSVSLIKKGIQL
jgi:hypothetical protein